jgi:transcriptional regulator with XRE-family HTH domain
VAQGVAGDPEADRILRRFGEQLRVARIVTRLTQTLVGERAGVQRKTVSLAERGELNLSWFVMYALADAVGFRLELVWGEVIDGDAHQVLLRFGMELRGARAAARLTQERIATRAGVSQGTVSGAELGEQNLRWSAMYALAAAVGYRLRLMWRPAGRPGAGIVL